MFVVAGLCSSASGLPFWVLHKLSDMIAPRKTLIFFMSVIFHVFVLYSHNNNKDDDYVKQLIIL